MVTSLQCIFCFHATTLLLYLLKKKKQKTNRGFIAEIQYNHSWENTKYFC